MFPVAGGAAAASDDRQYTPPNARSMPMMKRAPASTPAARRGDGGTIGGDGGAGAGVVASAARGTGGAAGSRSGAGNNVGPSSSGGGAAGLGGSTPAVPGAGSARAATVGSHAIPAETAAANRHRQGGRRARRSGRWRPAIQAPRIREAYTDCPRRSDAVGRVTEEPLRDELRAMRSSPSRRCLLLASIAALVADREAATPVGAADVAPVLRSTPGTGRT